MALRKGEVPDLGEERALRALRYWLEKDEEGRAVLDELIRDRLSGQRTLRQRLEQNAPPEVATYLSGSSNVGKLVNVASEFASLHIHPQGGTERPSPVRLSMKPLSSAISIGDTEPCRVRVRIENEDSRPRELELRISGWFSELSQIEGDQRIVVGSGAYADRQIDVAIAPTKAATLPAGTHQLETYLVDVENGTVLTRETVPLEVGAFHWIDAVIEPSEITRKQWRRAWVDYDFILRNRGNKKAEAAIGLAPGQSAVEVDFNEATVSLPLGTTRHVAVRVRPMRHAYLGERAYTFRLFANRRPQDNNTAAGVLRHVPLVSRKVLGWGSLGLLFLVFSLFVAPRSSPSSSIEGADRPATTSSSTPAASSSQRSTPGRPDQDPAQVVQAFFDAVNVKDYHKAWELGGKNLRMSRQRFADGFSRTDHVTVNVRSVSGATVSVELIADENGGQQHSVYRGNYTVRGGEIVAGHFSLFRRRTS